MAWNEWQNRLRRGDDMVAERERQYRRIRVCPKCGRSWIATLLDQECDYWTTRSAHDVCPRQCLPPLPDPSEGPLNPQPMCPQTKP
jgi:hypothetical protein